MSNQGHTMMLHTYNTPTMSLSSINFLHLTVSEIWYGQDFIGQGHYSKVKGQIKVTSWRCTPAPPNQCPYQVSTSYTLRFLRYRPDKILQVKVITARSKVKSRSHHDVAHLHPQTHVPTSINFLHLTVSEIWPGQNFIGQGHYGEYTVLSTRTLTTVPNSSNCKI